jgi:signal transduction histidine kinase
MEIARIEHSYFDMIKASNLLSEIYEKIDLQKSLEYSKLALAYNDSLLFIGNKSSIESYMNFDERQSQFELNAARKEFQDRLKINALLGSSFTLLVVAFLLFRSRRQKLKAKQHIEEAYDQLKATQSQLIQSEKMASLGELTAGIAHEIQNPLNFVNNFSEVSEDLIDEMHEDLLNGNRAEAENIITNLKHNLKKINHHGKRASSIVHGMLEHSRTGKKEKEPTDINQLADEYLRLAFQGLRAKDKSFNADFQTEFDGTLPKINVIPQDIGRVLLNLINNAFYAVDKKAKEGADGYKPLVIVSTKKVGEKVAIGVKDNGPGISEEIKAKIFQPFFTTKPTGSGTGLGLSLSYDIVKAHGGELNVETKVCEGSEFIIQLPI